MLEEYSKLSTEFLEWVYDNSDGGTPIGIDVAPFAQEHGMDRAGGFALVRYHKERGLVDDKGSSFGSAAARLTPNGVEQVEKTRQARSDPRLRIPAARTALLNWLWIKKHEGADLPVVEELLQSEYSKFHGTQFTPEDIDRASHYLSDKGLIKGVKVDGLRGPVRAELTTEGDDCVEHYGADVSEYERRSDNAAPMIFNIASNTGNIAANSRDFAMNATTNSGVSIQDLVMFARGIRQAAPVLGLPDSEVLELTTTADSLEQEAATGNPDENRLKRWGYTIM